MKVQKKISYMLAATLLLFLCCLLGIRYYLIFKNRSLFENKVEDKIQYFEQLLRYQQVSLEMFTFDKQVRSIVRRYLSSRNDLEMQTNLEDLIPSYGVNSVWIFSPDIKLLYHRCPLHTRQTEGCGLNEAILTRLFQRGSYYRHFFTTTPVGFTEILTSPVTISHDDNSISSPRALLFAGRLWSKTHLDQLTNNADAEVNMLAMSKGSDLKPAYAPATGRITFSKVLPGWDRRPVRRLFVAYETPIIKEFNKSSNIQLAMLFVFSLAIVCMLAFFFTRWIRNPLECISQALETNSSDPVKPITKHQTEFGRIAHMIQQFFKQQKSLISEINERKQAEKLLRTSEENYRVVFESTGTAMIIFDEDMIISMVNSEAEKLSGYSRDEIEGKKRWTDFIFTEDLEKMKNYHNARGHNSTAVPESYEFRMTDKTGAVKNIFQTVSMVPGTTKRIVSLLDITETKKIEQENKDLEAQLQRAEKMETIGTLAGGVAHDLNNVLSGIISYPELLLMEVDENSRMRKPLITIKESGERAAAIVQDLLTLARRGITTKNVVNLNTIVQEYCESPEFKMVKRHHPGVDFDIRLAEDLLNIIGSPVHLAKTVMNLLSNAAESISDRGAVNIATENRHLDRPLKGYDNIQEGDYAVLMVSDCGRGISPRDLEKIFEPFYTKKHMGRSGTGLGMSVVWGTVKDHKGYIEVASREEQGTTFTLYFPVTHEHVKSDKQDLSLDLLTGQGESILIVDDVATQRKIASAILQKLNYRVSCVESGEKAVEYMQRFSADLLLLDMIMDPGIDGLETYKRILAIHPGQQAIIASGFSETERVKEAQKLGAGAYIKKPYTLEKIGLAVKAELKKQSG